MQNLHYYQYYYYYYSSITHFIPDSRLLNQSCFVFLLHFATGNSVAVVLIIIVPNCVLGCNIHVVIVVIITITITIVIIVAVGEGADQLVVDSGLNFILLDFQFNWFALLFGLLVIVIIVIEAIIIITTEFTAITTKVIIIIITIKEEVKVTAIVIIIIVIIIVVVEVIESVEYIQHHSKPASSAEVDRTAVVDHNRTMDLVVLNLLSRKVEVIPVAAVVVDQSDSVHSEESEPSMSYHCLDSEGTFSSDSGSVIKVESKSKVASTVSKVITLINMEQFLDSVLEEAASLVSRLQWFSQSEVCIQLVTIPVQEYQILMERQSEAVVHSSRSSKLVAVSNSAVIALVAVAQFAQLQLVVLVLHISVVFMLLQSVEQFLALNQDQVVESVVAIVIIVELIELAVIALNVMEVCFEAAVVFVFVQPMVEFESELFEYSEFMLIIHSKFIIAGDDFDSGSGSVIGRFIIYKLG
ncbi:MAG: hypothetical protein EZS28_032292 [Streblomastix strix]|uniref:Uncharacterized protein n=1 Tax=Streblomastix strix TaxID=222440 RepID=A0A5J4UQ37_9EUKA|nr:MAG: hypothetical protein EZS28_032292 [Streblomastix strix]